MSDEISTTPALSMLNLANCVVKVPASWCKTYNTAENVLYFYTSIGCKRKGRYGVTSLKEVIVLSDMRLAVNIVSRSINITSLGISEEPLTDVMQLEKLIQMVDGMGICTGCVGDEALYGLHSTVAYKDKFDILRHKTCTLLLADQKVCCYCRKLKKTLQKMRQRHSKKSKIIRNRMPTSPTERKLVQEVRKQKITRLREKKRAAKSIAKWRGEYRQKSKELKKMSEEQLSNLLDKSKLPSNECEVIKQILNVTKCKGATGRRYSEEWIILCMLLHMRSPSAYRFLRDINMLPVPDVRTIRR